MRREVIELRELGPLPSSDRAVHENLQQLVDKYASLIISIQKPVTDEEARVLVSIFGPDECFGLTWSLIHLIETAPGWPLADCIKIAPNEGVRLLKARVENAARGRPVES